MPQNLEKTQGQDRDPIVDRTRESFGATMLTVLDSVDRSIDAAAEHVAGSAIAGLRTFLRELFTKKTKNNHPKRIYEQN